MKKLKHVVGNLLTNTTVEVIGHQANCQNTFGSGIARSIREMFPAAYYADTDSHREHKNSLGNYSAAYINSGDRKGTNISIIYNLYGQNLFGKEKRQTNYEALFSSLEKMSASLTSSEHDEKMFDFTRVPVVGFPYKMGSDRGGGSWDIVERLIEVAFDGYENDVIIVKFE